MPTLTTHKPEDGLRSSPVYWFTLMEAARTRFDFVAALRARDELERLGIHISYRCPLSDRKGAPTRA